MTLASYVTALEQNVSPGL